MNPVDYLAAAFDPAKDTVKRVLGKRLVSSLDDWKSDVVFGNYHKYVIDYAGRRYVITPVRGQTLKSFKPKVGGYRLSVTPGQESPMGYLTIAGFEFKQPATSLQVRTLTQALDAVNKHLYRFPP